MIDLGLALVSRPLTFIDTNREWGDTEPSRARFVDKFSHPSYTCGPFSIMVWLHLPSPMPSERRGRPMTDGSLALACPPARCRFLIRPQQLIRI